MDRIIKFRGKSIIVNEWMYGSLLVLPNGRTYIVESDGHTAYRCEIEPDTVGQFTGLHDCNGKEIYEGDIVKTSISKNSIAVVKWGVEQSAFIAQMKNSNQWYYLSRCYEVIGNIYDNLPLLKGGENEATERI